MSLTRSYCHSNIRMYKPQIAFQNLGNGNNTPNVVTIDTFAVQVSTVFLDSFTTSGTKAQLLGRYIDPYFGNDNFPELH